MDSLLSLRTLDTTRSTDGPTASVIAVATAAVCIHGARQIGRHLGRERVLVPPRLDAPSLKLSYRHVDADERALRVRVVVLCVRPPVLP